MAPSTTADIPPRHFKGAWRMVVLAFTAQNFAIGLSLGSFGVSVLAIEGVFHTTRTLASIGGSLVVLSFGVLGPVVAVLLERYTIRRTMLAGVVLGSIGYVALALAPNIWLFLSAFVFLVGPGATMAGNLPGSVLLNNWFLEDKGRAIGLMMMPLFIMLVPLASTPIIQAYGLRVLYLVLAAANLLMLPIALAVRDRPPQAEVAHARPAPGLSESNGGGASLMTRMQILARPEFWLIILAVGLLNGSGMVKLTHLVALLAEKGRSIEQATLLLVLSGGAGMIGSMAFGWLADKIGGALALMVNGLMQAASWTILLFHVGLPLLSLDAAIMGVCGAGIFSAHVVLLTHLFGPQNLARSLSLIGMFAIAINFISPPVAGLLHDATGSYLPVLFTVIGACLVASTLLLVLSLRERARAASGYALMATPKAALDEGAF